MARRQMGLQRGVCVLGIACEGAGCTNVCFYLQETAM